MNEKSTEQRLREALNKIQDWASGSIDLVTCANGPWDLNVYQEARAALALPATPPTLRGNLFMVEMESQAHKLRELRQNWDSYGSAAISEAAIQAALNLLHATVRAPALGAAWRADRLAECGASFDTAGKQELDAEQCDGCGCSLVHVAGKGVSALVCPVCDADSSALSDDAPVTPPNRIESATWLIHFDDAEMGPEIFTGEGAEEGARARFARLLESWNCHLFCNVPVAPVTPVRREYRLTGPDHPQGYYKAFAESCSEGRARALNPDGMNNGVRAEQRDVYESPWRLLEEKD